MSNNTHYSKIASFWKSLIAAVTITFGVFCNTEARVTREVAEATIPYLLEAVGIPPNGALNAARRNAIVHMLYTDTGQREMVNWAKDGVFPLRLMTDLITQNAVFVPNNLYLDAWLRLALEQVAQQLGGVNPQHIQNMIGMLPPTLATPTLLSATQDVRNSSIGALFPPGPGTFSSYATHDSRLGYHALNGNSEDICSAIINHAIGIVGFSQEAQGIINRLRQYNGIIDNKLAKVLFILDICESVGQIKEILNQTLGANHARDNAIDIAVNNTTYNEYNHRPVSATSVVQGQRRVGDCGETLYRHLINIAIQNNRDVTRAISCHEYNIGHLPIQLRQNYYNVLYGAHNIITTPRTHAEAGRMRLANHDTWKTGLRAVPTIGNITNTSIGDISRVLNVLQMAVQGGINLNFRQQNGINFQVPLMVLSAQMQQNNQIEQALNALDGRGNDAAGNQRFLAGSIINIPRPIVPQGHAYLQYIGNVNLHDLTWITDIIEIVDRLWNRRIIVGCSTQHAEIISIQ